MHSTVDALRALDALPPPAPLPPRRPQAPQQAPEWDVHGLLWEYETHPQRALAWTSYKPVTDDDLDRWHLGVGTLPNAVLCTHPRLVYLVIEDGQLVAVRGRSYLKACQEHCPKWLSAKGSRAALWGWDHVNPEHCAGKHLVVVENPVDAMLLMQTPGMVACASTGGAGTWRPEWTERVVAARPETVLVLYDNDLAGIPNSETRRREVAAYRLKHDGKEPNEDTAAVRLVAALREAPSLAGRVVVHDWPPGTPKGADAGWYIGRQWRMRVANA